MSRSCLLLLLLPAALLADDKPAAVLDLWPGKPPGVTAASGEEKDTTRPKDGLVAGRPVIRLGNVSKPTVTIYRPEAGKANGACVVVCPGGGYNILAMDLEGTEVCRWLNGLGITAALLKYRVPAPKTWPRHPSPQMDAQRAVRLVRSRARKWGVDPKKIGILGFSAGGHLAALTATVFDTRPYEAVDAADEVSSRPDFAVLVYPGYLADRKTGALSPELKVTKDAPPMFLAHAGDDPVPAENSVQLYLALRRVKVPTELHVFEKGGHGYGLRKTDRPVTSWPALCEAWLRERGLLAAP
jgi:acetyl esterase/lipase